MNVKMECLQGTTPVSVEGLPKIQFLQIHVFQGKRDIKFCQNWCITCGCRKLKCIPPILIDDL